MLPGHTPRVRDEVERQHHRQVLEQYCALLSDNQLVELLKWPVVFDDAGQVILAEFESRTGATFDGRRSSFIHQAESLGFDHATLRSPASRPPDPGRDP